MTLTFPPCSATPAARRPPAAPQLPADRPPAAPRRDADEYDDELGSPSPPPARRCRRRSLPRLRSTGADPAIMDTANVRMQASPPTGQRKAVHQAPCPAIMWLESPCMSCVACVCLVAPLLSLSLSLVRTQVQRGDLPKRQSRLDAHHHAQVHRLELHGGPAGIPGPPDSALADP